MSLSTTTNKVQYTGNGAVTVFAIPFPFLLNSDLKVIITMAGVDSVKTITTDYALSGAGSQSGGTLTMVVAPANLSLVTILRSVVFSQLVSYVPNDSFPSKTHESALDKLTMLAQQLNEIFGRTIRYPETEALASSAIMAAKSLRTNTLFGFDANGDLYFYSINPSLLTLIAPVSVGTAQILDGAVTAVKLATTLDLSGKTLTLPNGSVTTAVLAAAIDLRQKVVSFPVGSILSKNIANKNVTGDSIRDCFVVAGPVGVGTSGKPIVVAGAGSAAVNGTYVYQGLDGSSNPWWKFGNFQLTYNITAHLWEINDVVAVILYYQSDSTYSDSNSSPENTIAWVRISGAAPAPTVVLSMEKLEVGGNVKAAKFIGDGSSLTNIPVDPNTQISALPICVEGGNRSSDRGSYLLTAGGLLVSCGLSSSGKLGHGSLLQTAAQLRFATFSVGVNAIDGVSNNLNNFADSIVKIKCRLNNTFALSKNGILYVSGDNAYGQCGQGDTVDCNVFKAIRFGADSSHNVAIASFSVSDSQNAQCSCLAIDVNGQVWSWGYNGNGQCGIGNTTTPQSTPIKLSTIIGSWAAKTAIQVLCIGGLGGDTYVLFNDGTYWAAGFNSAGELGLGHTTQTTTFALSSFTNVAQLYGRGHNDGINRNSFYVRSNANLIYGCGYNANGQLGVGNTTAANALAVVTGLGAVTFFQTGGDTNGWCFAILASDGTAKSWGYNGSGQLGVNDLVDKTSTATPTELNTAITSEGATIIKIVLIGNSTSSSTYALFSNGTIYATGSNGTGQLGIGNQTDVKVFTKTFFPYSSTLIFTDICGASIGVNSQLQALRNDKTVFSCGYNGLGNLSLGEAIAGVLTLPTKMRV